MMICGCKDTNNFFIKKGKTIKKFLCKERITVKIFLHKVKIPYLTIESKKIWA